MSDLKEQVRPIYSELIGYLESAPPHTKLYEHIPGHEMWEQVNNTIKELDKVTGNNYGRFSIIASEARSRGLDNYVYVAHYRQKLSGLIGTLHAEYFSGEQSPINNSSVANTVITQTQQQNQSVHMLLEIQSRLDEKMSDFSDGSQEKTFLQKLKESLSSVKNTTQLINHILKTAKDTGVSMEELLKIFY